MKSTIIETKKALDSLNETMPKNYKKYSTEAILYARLDELKGIFQGSIFTISEYKEISGISSIGFSIILKQFLYEKFLNELSSIQAKTFPFINLNDISIFESNENGITYQIEGAVVTPTKI